MQVAPTPSSAAGYFQRLLEQDDNANNEKNPSSDFTAQGFLGDEFLQRIAEFQPYDIELFAQSPLGQIKFPALGVDTLIEIIEELKKTIFVKVRESSYEIEIPLIELLRKQEKLEQKFPNTKITNYEFVGGIVYWFLRKYIRDVFKDNQFETLLPEGILDRLEKRPADIDVRLYSKEANILDLSQLSHNVLEILLEANDKSKKKMEGSSEEKRNFFAINAFLKFYAPKEHHNVHYSIASLEGKEIAYDLMFVKEMKRPFLFPRDALRLNFTPLWNALKRNHYEPDVLIAKLRSGEEKVEIKPETYKKCGCVMLSIVDQISKLIRAIDLHEINLTGFWALLSAYAKGFRCLNDVSQIEQTLLKTFFENKNKPEFEYLKSTLKNHHKDSPAAAFVITYHAVQLLKNCGDFSFFWKEIEPFIQDSRHHFLKQIYRVIFPGERIPGADIKEVEAFLQVKAFLQLCTSENQKDFQPTLLMHDKKPALQIDLNGAHLLLPFNLVEAFKILKETKNEVLQGLINELIVPKREYTQDSLIYRNLKSLGFDWDELEKVIENPQLHFELKLARAVLEKDEKYFDQIVDEIPQFLENGRLIKSISHLPNVKLLFDDYRTNEQNIKPIHKWILALARFNYSQLAQKSFKLWKKERGIDSAVAEALANQRPDLALKVMKTLNKEEAIKVFENISKSCLSSRPAISGFPILLDGFQWLLKTHRSIECQGFLAEAQWLVRQYIVQNQIPQACAFLNFLKDQGFNSKDFYSELISAYQTMQKSLKDKQAIKEAAVEMIQLLCLQNGAVYWEEAFKMIETLCVEHEEIEWSKKVFDRLYQESTTTAFAFVFSLTQILGDEKKLSHLWKETYLPPWRTLANLIYEGETFKEVSAVLQAKAFLQACTENLGEGKRQVLQLDLGNGYLFFPFCPIQAFQTINDSSHPKLQEWMEEMLFPVTAYQHNPCVKASLKEKEWAELEGMIASLKNPRLTDELKLACSVQTRKSSDMGDFIHYWPKYLERRILFSLSQLNLHPSEAELIKEYFEKINEFSNPIKKWILLLAPKFPEQAYALLKEHVEDLEQEDDHPNVNLVVFRALIFKRPDLALKIIKKFKIDGATKGWQNICKAYQKKNEFFIESHLLDIFYWLFEDKERLKNLNEFSEEIKWIARELYNHNEIEKLYQFLTFVNDGGGCVDHFLQYFTNVILDPKNSPQNKKCAWSFVFKTIDRFPIFKIFPKINEGIGLVDDQDENVKKFFFEAKKSLLNSKSSLEDKQTDLCSFKKAFSELSTTCLTQATLDDIQLNVVEVLSSQQNLELWKEACSLLQEYFRRNKNLAENKDFWDRVTRTIEKIGSIERIKNEERFQLLECLENIDQLSFKDGFDEVKKGLYSSYLTSLLKVNSESNGALGNKKFERFCQCFKVFHPHVGNADYLKDLKSQGEKHFKLSDSNSSLILSIYEVLLLNDEKQSLKILAHMLCKCNNLNHLTECYQILEQKEESEDHVLSIQNAVGKLPASAWKNYHFSFKTLLPLLKFPDSLKEPLSVQFCNNLTRIAKDYLERSDLFSCNEVIKKLTIYPINKKTFSEVQGLIFKYLRKNLEESICDSLELWDSLKKIGYFEAKSKEYKQVLFELIKKVCSTADKNDFLVKLFEAYKEVGSPNKEVSKALKLHILLLMENKNSLKAWNILQNYSHWLTLKIEISLRIKLIQQMCESKKLINAAKMLLEFLKKIPKENHNSMNAIAFVIVDQLKESKDPKEKEIFDALLNNPDVQKVLASNPQYNQSIAFPYLPSSVQVFLHWVISAIKAAQKKEELERLLQILEERFAEFLGSSAAIHMTAKLAAEIVTRISIIEEKLRIDLLDKIVCNVKHTFEHQLFLKIREDETEENSARIAKVDKITIDFKFVLLKSILNTHHIDTNLKLSVLDCIYDVIKSLRAEDYKILDLDLFDELLEYYCFFPFNRKDGMSVRENHLTKVRELLTLDPIKKLKKKNWYPLCIPYARVPDSLMLKSESLDFEAPFKKTIEKLLSWKTKESIEEAFFLVHDQNFGRGYLSQNFYSEFYNKIIDLIKSSEDKFEMLEVLQNEIKQTTSFKEESLIDSGGRAFYNLLDLILTSMLETPFSQDNQAEESNRFQDFMLQGLMNGIFEGYYRVFYTKYVKKYFQKLKDYIGSEKTNEVTFFQLFHSYLLFITNEKILNDELLREEGLKDLYHYLISKKTNSGSFFLKHMMSYIADIKISTESRWLKNAKADLRKRSISCSKESFQQMMTLMSSCFPCVGLKYLLDIDIGSDKNGCERINWTFEALYNEIHKAIRKGKKAEKYEIFQKNLHHLIDYVIKQAKTNESVQIFLKKHLMNWLTQLLEIDNSSNVLSLLNDPLELLFNDEQKIEARKIAIESHLRKKNSFDAAQHLIDLIHDFPIIDNKNLENELNMLLVKILRKLFKDQYLFKDEELCLEFAYKLFTLDFTSQCIEKNPKLFIPYFQSFIKYTARISDFDKKVEAIKQLIQKHYPSLDQFHPPQTEEIEIQLTELESKNEIDCQILLNVLKNLKAISNESVVERTLQIFNDCLCGVKNWKGSSKEIAKCWLYATLVLNSENAVLFYLKNHQQFFDQFKDQEINKYKSLRYFFYNVNKYLNKDSVKNYEHSITQMADCISSFSIEDDKKIYLPQMQALISCNLVMAYLHLLDGNAKASVEILNNINNKFLAKEQIQTILFILIEVIKDTNLKEDYKLIDEICKILTHFYSDEEADQMKLLKSCFPYKKLTIQALKTAKLGRESPYLEEFENFLQIAITDNFSETQQSIYECLKYLNQIGSHSNRLPDLWKMFLEKGRETDQDLVDLSKHYSDSLMGVYKNSTIADEIIEQGKSILRDNFKENQSSFIWLYQLFWDKLEQHFLLRSEDTLVSKEKDINTDSIKNLNEQKIIFLEELLKESTQRDLDLNAIAQFSQFLCDQIIDLLDCDSPNRIHLICHYMFSPFLYNLGLRTKLVQIAEEKGIFEKQPELLYQIKYLCPDLSESDDHIGEKRKLELIDELTTFLTKDNNKYLVCEYINLLFVKIVRLLLKKPDLFLEKFKTAIDIVLKNKQYGYQILADVSKNIFSYLPSSESWAKTMTESIKILSKNLFDLEFVHVNSKLKYHGQALGLLKRALYEDRIAYEEYLTYLERILESRPPCEEAITVFFDMLLVTPKDFETKMMNIRAEFHSQRMAFTTKLMKQILEMNDPTIFNFTMDNFKTKIDDIYRYFPVEKNELNCLISKCLQN